MHRVTLRKDEMACNNTSHLYPSPPTTTPADSSKPDPNIRAVKLTLYLVIFLVSSVGNSLVFLVIMRKNKMKTVTNYFILNLAIADLLLTFICIPFDIPVQEMDNIWPYGSFMCKVLYPLQTMCLFASVFTLTAVSLTRYWAIVHPFRRQLTISKAKWVIVVIWFLSLLPVSPYIHVLQHKGHYCEEDWSGNTNSRKIYTIILFVTEYAIPLGIILMAYISIGRELSKRSSSGNKLLRSRQTEETAKVVHMLVVVTLMFAVCVLPTNIMWLWLDFGDAEAQFPYFWDVLAFCNILMFCNSAANPICYTALNENYRKEIKRYLVKFCQRRTHGLATLEEMEMTAASKETNPPPNTSLTSD